MDERLGFELDIDADTHKLPPAVQLLAQMDDRLMHIGKSLERFEQHTRRMDGFERKARSMSGGFTEMASAIQLVERGLGTATRAWEAFERGSSYAIQQMGERSASIRGYTQLLGGDKKQANLEYYRAQEFAQKTDFTSETIEKSQARLLAQGFRGKDLYATLFSAADLAAIMPGDKNQTLERVTMAMSQIKAKGKLQGEELTQQLAEAGLNTTLVKQQLAKAYGIKVGDVDKKLSAGQVTADVALPAIQRAILQQLGTSKAGEYATSRAGSLTSLISNRDEAIKNLLKSFDADENLPAMERYKKALKEQGALFDQNSKTGKQLSLVVQDMANAALDAKSAWAEFSSGFLESFADSYTRQLNRDGRSFDAEQTTQAVKNLGEAIGRLGSVAARALGSTDSLVGTLAQLSANTINKTADAASAYQQGKYREYASGALDVLNTIGRYSPAGLLASATGPGAADYLLKRNVESDLLGLGKRTPEKFDLQSEAFARETRIATRAVIPKVSKAEERAAKAEASGKHPYRGVFWAYDFGGTSTGKWATPQNPSAQELLAGSSHTTAAALTTAINGSQPDQRPVQIIIQGYNRDKRELAQEIVEALASVSPRLSRKPR